MKRITRRILSSLISILVLFESIICSIGSLTAFAYDGWSDAYYDFTLNGGYRDFDVDYYDDVAEDFTSDDKLISMFLYDMDEDGIPELFMSNGDPGQMSAYSYIFTYSSGKIIQLSTLYHNIGYTDNAKHKGVFAYASYFGNLDYYEKVGQKVEIIPISNENRLNGGELEIYSQELYDCKINYFSEVSFPELKKIGWSAFCSRYGFSSSEQKTTQKVTASNKKPKLKSANEKNTALKDFLAHCHEINYYGIGEGDYFSFDCKAVSNPTVISRLLNSASFDIFADIEYSNVEAQKDPRGVFGDCFRRTNAYQLDWLIMNVFNYSKNDISKMKEIGEKRLKEEPTLGFYEENGYYYCSSEDGAGGTTCFRAKVDEDTKTGSYDYVSYTIEEYEYDNPKTLTQHKLYAQLEYKTTDGTGYWSLLKNSDAKFWNDSEDESKETSGSQTDNNQTDISDTSPAEQEAGLTVLPDETDVSSPEDDFAVTESDTESADSEADVNQNKSNSKAIIITSVSAAVLLASAAAFVLLRKKKIHSTVPDDEPIQKAEIQQAAPSVPPESAESVESPAESTGKSVPDSRQAGSKIDYSCASAGHGGQCQMCKSEQEELYVINASKGGSVQSRTVCRTCAEKIIYKFKKDNES